MPFTFLTDSQVERWSSVRDDPELQRRLDDIRWATGERWLISRRTFWRRQFFRHHEITEHRLYFDAHGEWGVVDVHIGRRRQLFSEPSEESRAAVMNWIDGFIASRDWPKARPVSEPEWSPVSQQKTV